MPALSWPLNDTDCCRLRFAQSMLAIYCTKFSCEHDQLPIDVCYTK